MFKIIFKAHVVESGENCRFSAGVEGSDDAKKVLRAMYEYSMSMWEHRDYYIAKRKVGTCCKALLRGLCYGETEPPVDARAKTADRCGEVATTLPTRPTAEEHLVTFTVELDQDGVFKRSVDYTSACPELVKAAVAEPTEVWNAIDVAVNYIYARIDEKLKLTPSGACAVAGSPKATGRSVAGSPKKPRDVAATALRRTHERSRSKKPLTIRPIYTYMIRGNRGVR